MTSQDFINAAITCDVQKDGQITKMELFNLFKRMQGITSGYMFNRGVGGMGMNGMGVGVGGMGMGGMGMPIGGMSMGGMGMPIGGMGMGGMGGMSMGGMGMPIGGMGMGGMGMGGMGMGGMGMGMGMDMGWNDSMMMGGFW
jgi:hypothetical protein